MTSYGESVSPSFLSIYGDVIWDDLRGILIVVIAGIIIFFLTRNLK